MLTTKIRSFNLCKQALSPFLNKIIKPTITEMQDCTSFVKTTFRGMKKPGLHPTDCLGPNISWLCDDLHAETFLKAPGRSGFSSSALVCSWQVGPTFW